MQGCRVFLYAWNVHFEVGFESQKPKKTKHNGLEAFLALPQTWDTGFRGTTLFWACIGKGESKVD